MRRRTCATSAAATPRCAASAWTATASTCADENFDVCQEITAYRLRRDGILTGRDYEEGAERCRFIMHPRWHDASPYGVELPTG